MINNLKQFIEGKTKYGHSFELLIQALILISLASLTLETLPNITVLQKNILSNIDKIIVFIFIIEYILRICVSDKKKKFVFSFYGIADLLAILPSLVLLGFDLQFIRVLRFFRIFRLLKLARYNKALDRVQKAFGIAKEELFIFVTTITSMLYFASVGIYQFEHTAQPENFGSIFDSFWWAIVTLTTVGYGDVVPITLGGRLFTMAFLLLGVGIIAAPTGLMASAISRAHHEEAEEAKEQ